MVRFLVVFFLILGLDTGSKIVLIVRSAVKLPISHPKYTPDVWKAFLTFCYPIIQMTAILAKEENMMIFALNLLFLSSLEIQVDIHI